MPRFAPFLLLLVLTACGGGPQVPSQASAGTPKGEGIVKDVKGITRRAETVVEGKGGLLLDVTHTDRAVNLKVIMEVHPAGDEKTVVQKSQGNEDLQLAPGAYDVSMTYNESETLRGYTGWVRGAQVTLGWNSKYQVSIAAPIGQIRMRFATRRGENQPEENVSNQVNLTIWKAEDDPDLASPVWEGSAGDAAIVAEGMYVARAVYTDPTGNRTTEWYRDLKVDGGMAKTEKAVVWDLAFSGVRVDAFNFGRDVNGVTQVFFFAPGANTKSAQSKFNGRAGEIVAVDPGFYDVLVRYQPSDTAQDVVGERVLPNVEVIERGGRRVQLDLEKPLANVRIRASVGEEDLSDSLGITIIRQGADAEASTPVFDETGVPEFPVPAGTYDIYLAWKEGDAAAGSKKKVSFRNIDLCNGCLWEQNFEGPSDKWTAAPVKRPTQPLRPVAFQEIGVGAQAPTGDDDDSAAPAPAEAGTPAPGTPTPAGANATPAPPAATPAPTAPKN
jgi:hypothetical protein